MSKDWKTPKFPDSYIGEKAEEYNSLPWMERNQKKTTLRCIQYLYDKNLGLDIDVEKPYLILDLGCGTGFSSEVLLNYGFNVIGIEILKDMIKKALLKYQHLDNNQNFHLILGDINYIPLRNYSIDHIISVSAYNFIVHNKFSIDEKKSLMKSTAISLNKLLRKKGRIIIEFYPKNERDLNLFKDSFIQSGFDGYMIKDNPHQSSGQTFLLLKKERNFQRRG
jgi:18S rRNA (guanine1575-N7)-methyltransferase